MYSSFQHTFLGLSYELVIILGPKNTDIRNGTATLKEMKCDSPHERLMHRGSTAHLSWKDKYGSQMWSSWFTHVFKRTLNEHLKIGEIAGRGGTRL